MIKIYYSHTPFWRAEVLRVSLFIKDIPFEDIRVSREEFVHLIKTGFLPNGKRNTENEYVWGPRFEWEIEPNPKNPSGKVKMSSLPKQQMQQKSISTAKAKQVENCKDKEQMKDNVNCDS